MSDQSYKGLLIRTAIRSGRSLAAVLTGEGASARRLTVLEGGFEADVIATAQQWIDAELEANKSARPPSGTPSMQEFAMYLDAHRLAPHEEHMLLAHLRAPGRCLTATQLAQAAGWKTYEGTNSHYGKLGKKIADFLNLSVKGSDEKAATFVLAEGADRTSSGEWVWKMRPELADALSTSAAAKKA